MSHQAVDLTAYLSPERVLLIDQSPTQTEVWDRLIASITAAGTIADLPGFRQAIHDREAVTSTAIGNRIAIPHARLPSIRAFALAMAIVPQGISGSTRDGLPLQVVVMMAAPEDERSRHLQVLASVTARLSQAPRRESLVATRDTHEAYRLFIA